MTDPGQITFSSNTLTLVLSACAVLVSGIGVYCAWRQSRSSQQQRLTQEQGQRFMEMRETYSARIDTLTATVEDLQSQLRILERQNRVLTEHAERCEQQLAALQARLGFGGGLGGAV